jgi:hypothetical protein
LPETTNSPVSDATVREIFSSILIQKVRYPLCLLLILCVLTWFGLPWILLLPSVALVSGTQGFNGCSIWDGGDFGQRVKHGITESALCPHFLPHHLAAAQCPSFSGPIEKIHPLEPPLALDGDTFLKTVRTQRSRAPKLRNMR